MMIEGIQAALDFPHHPDRLRFVCFLTDGYIGNEAEILGEVRERLGASRIFSFGVGSSVNRYLLNRMAKLGKGASAYLGLEDDATIVMEQFIDRVSHPALTDLAIHWGGMQVRDVFPRKLPDLFLGRPVIVTGRFLGEGKQTIRITGQAEKDELELSLPVDLDQPVQAAKALPSVWARMQIADLHDKAAHSRNRFLHGRIKQVALDYNPLSAYTAFVAVDSSARTTGRQGTTVPVPVPVPDGVKYKTTVAE